MPSSSEENPAAAASAPHPCESCGSGGVGDSLSIKPKIKKAKRGPKLTNKINPEYEFPEEPEDFKEKYESVAWTSAEHDELGKKLFKSKEGITHNEDFGKYFPRYSVVKQNKRASKPYARRKVNAFIHKSSIAQKAASAAAENEAEGDSSSVAAAED